MFWRNLFLFCITNAECNLFLSILNLIKFPIYFWGETPPQSIPTISQPFENPSRHTHSNNGVAVACLAKSPWKSGASERVNHTQCHWIRNRYAVSWDEQNLGMVSIGRMVEVYCPFSWKVVREWNVESWLICFLILPFRFFCVEKSSLLLLLNLRCHLDSRSSLIKGWIKINDQHFECLRTVWFAARTFVKVWLLAKSVHLYWLPFYSIPSKQTS